MLLRDTKTKFALVGIVRLISSNKLLVGNQTILATDTEMLCDKGWLSLDIALSAGFVKKDWDGRLFSPTDLEKQLVQQK